MFDRKDYFGWLLGAFVLGGLIVNPLVYIFYRKIAYFNALIPSLAVSFVVAISVTRNGAFSWLRTLVAIAIVFAVRHFYYMKTDTLFEVGGGFMMFLVTIVCAFAGTESYRVHREFWELRKDARKRQQTDVMSGDKSETHTGLHS
jgi:hypothetical protein